MVSTKMSLSFNGWGSLYTVEQDQCVKINQTGWSALRNNYPFLIEDDRENIQLIQLPVYSETLWEITPPGIVELVDGFQKALDDPFYPRPSLTMKYTFNREREGL